MTKYMSRCMTPQWLYTAESFIQPGIQQNTQHHPIHDRKSQQYTQAPGICQSGLSDIYLRSAILSRQSRPPYLSLVSKSNNHLSAEWSIVSDVNNRV